jgi:hypothetical protein
MRRRPLWGVAVVFIAVTAGCDWPIAGYGPGNAHYTPDLSISSSAAASGFTIAWSARADNDVWATPVVAGGVTYVTGNQLYAFDAAGRIGCSGSPTTCAPLWIGQTVPFGANSPSGSLNSPAVADGVVYVQSKSPDNRLYAFDAAGKTNCSGTPKVCRPLWTASSGSVSSAPVVANGIVYVASGRLFAFDAHGATNCGGTPKTCRPLWVTADTAGSGFVAVSNGFAYVPGTSNTLFAYDDDGDNNCSGVPLTCAPLWTANIGPHSLGAPAVADNVVYIGSSDYDPWCQSRLCPVTAQPLFAFDANGITNCSGAPKTCAPLWTTTVGANVPAAIAGGVAYTGDFNGTLYAFDVTGRTNCSGTPRKCAPLWRADNVGELLAAPSVANGVVYLAAVPDPFAAPDGRLYTFDAAGRTNCGGTPNLCFPLSTTTVPGTAGGSSPTIANGTVYTGSSSLNLYAFKPKTH